MSNFNTLENALHDTCNDHSEQTQHYATNIITNFLAYIFKIKKRRTILKYRRYSFWPAFFLIGT